MMINFAATDLGCNVYCSAVAAEGYEVGNVMVTNGFSKGFLSANFVKPPVDVIFSFQYPLELKAIDINPKVSVHCTQIISIYVSERQWTQEFTQESTHFFWKPCGLFQNLHVHGDEIIRFNNPQSRLEFHYFFPQVPHTNIKPFDRNTFFMSKVQSIRLRLHKGILCSVKFDLRCSEVCLYLGSAFTMLSYRNPTLYRTKA
jgi:hypothetical protein